MSFRLKNKHQLKQVALLTAILLVGVGAVFAVSGAWTVYDHKFLDYFYGMAVDSGRGPSVSHRIVYLVATDDTYGYFGKNYLDRNDIARVNQALSELGPAAVAFDIIFANPGNPKSDQALSLSFKKLARPYLPIGLDVESQRKPSGQLTTSTYKKIRSRIQQIAENGSGTPYFASRLFLQNELFSNTKTGPSHIFALSDSDGTYRHQAMLIKVHHGFVPSLSFEMFLDDRSIPLRTIKAHWGDEITIPADKKGPHNNYLSIPITTKGEAFIPYPKTWGLDFPAMTMHEFIEAYADNNLRGNLLDFFEDKFVFIGDVATGTSDLGPTALEDNTPLITQHAAMLNAMLTGNLYRRWRAPQVASVVVAIGILLGLAATVRSSWFLYFSGVTAIASLAWLTWIQMIASRLFPLTSASIGTLTIFIGIVAGLEIMTGRERRFIKKAFSRYVPEQVVNTLLAKPGILKLGGEERDMTVLFSDLASFTSISERLAVKELVYILNQYLTAMTEIVLAHGGIIDKYEGDAIMAEFGTPVPLLNHADRAVSTALAMQGKLNEMRAEWIEQGLPELSCRIGINTGTMMVGNMGSDQVFDYTVIGDAVNLASRLEGANKQYNTNLMISEFTLEGLTQGMFKTRLLDVIKVKGKNEAVKVYEVYGEGSDPLSLEHERYYTIYQEAFETFLGRDFAAAQKRFEKALALRPEDPASKWMIERINAIIPNELSYDWDGSIALNTK